MASLSVAAFPPNAAFGEEDRYARGWSRIKKIGKVSPASGGVRPLFSEVSEHIIFPHFARSEDPRLAVYRTDLKGKVLNLKEFPKKLGSPRELTSAMGPRGNLHLAFIDSRERESAVYYARVGTEDELKLSSFSRISEFSQRIRSPHISIGEDGKIFIVWSAPAGSQYKVNVAVKDGKGKKVYEGVTPPRNSLDDPSVLPIEEGIFLSWVQEGSHPKTEQVKFARLVELPGSLEGEVSVAGTDIGEELKRRPQLIDNTEKGRIYLICRGNPEVEKFDSSSLLLAKFNYRPELLEVLQLVKPKGGALSQPDGCFLPTGGLSLCWVRASKGASPEIWYAKFDLDGNMRSRSVYLSKSEGEINRAPICRKNYGDNVFAFWTVLDTEEERNRFLMYRNTMNPVPVSFWRKIGVSVENPYMDIFYSLIFSAGAVPFGFMIPNIFPIIGSWAVSLMVGRYFLVKSGKLFGHLFFLLPSSILFCLFHPANPLFIETDLVELAFISPIYQYLGFAVAISVTIFLAYRYDWTVKEPLGFLLGTLTWSYLFGFLMAFPGTLSSF